jgi:Fe-S-cluster-containing dehydrogenase component/DMSO reductase anchor subunit
VLSIDKRLQAQRDLTAVERFAERHTTGPEPEQAKFYRSLLPTTLPRDRQQYSFEVDLDRCTGCKACVSACHSLNGLDEAELWRNVGTIQSLNESHPRIQTVTSSCHHCIEPACMIGCPTGAYEKDAITGIVKHLDDQCFGCQYCTLMCPYDAPKFSQTRGIVRKCDMCSERLKAGEAPACVQACPNEAIAIRIVDHSAITAAAIAGEFVAGAPHPKATLPTTRYLSSQKRPDLLAVDRDLTRTEHTHLPLVIMLTLTQLGVGTLVFSVGFGLTDLRNTPTVAAQTVAAFAATLIALLASVFHLGRPLLAWRAVINLKTSWLSREALAFGLFAKASAVYVLSYVPLDFPGRSILNGWQQPLALVTAVLGVAGVFCSVMVYVATQRPHWAWPRTGIAFFGALVLLGSACATLVTSLMSDITQHPSPAVVFGLLTVFTGAIIKLTFEHRRVHHTPPGSPDSVEKMARTIRERLNGFARVRTVVGLIGGILIPIALLIGLVPPVAWTSALTIAFTLLLCGELLERVLFFRAAPASRMPGNIS